MAELRTAHTADLSAGELQAIRLLLEGAFTDGFTDDDYEHALGGMHTLAWEGGELVGHGSVVMRRVVHGNRALRVGYVEGVAVRADRRRRGHGATVMGVLEARAASTSFASVRGTGPGDPITLDSVAGGAKG